MILSPITGDRKIRTPEELGAVMKEPRRSAPTRYVWLHKSLVEESHRLWQEMSTRLGTRCQAAAETQNTRASTLES
jgi:hypothetical protein